MTSHNLSYDKETNQTTYEGSAAQQDADTSNQATHLCFKFIYSKLREKVSLFEIGSLRNMPDSVSQYLICSTSNVWTSGVGWHCDGVSNQAKQLSRGREN